jgi:hypothetical protein
MHGAPLPAEQVDALAAYLSRLISAICDSGEGACNQPWEAEPLTGHVRRGTRTSDRREEAWV